jgi:hypothetical protein
MAHAHFGARTHVAGMSWTTLVHILAIIRIVHVAVGVVAFVVLPVALLTKKGSKRHVSFGRVYAYAMGVLAITGVPLAARGLFFHDAARRANALFLFFIALLASNGAWMGIRALRAHRSGASARSLLDLVAPSALLVASVGLGVIGLTRGVVLHTAFALLGASLAVGQLRYWLRTEHTRADVIAMHIGGMGVSSITTLTAFLVTNARFVFHLGAFNLFVWITPSIVGGIAIGIAQRAWRARLTSPSRA